jgi:hypothetical protein
MMISRRLSTLVSVACLAVTATSAGAQEVDSAKNAAASFTAGAAAGAVCPPIQRILNKGYHDDDMCNVQYFNEYKENVRRDITFQSLKSEGGAARVPNAKTVTCPQGEPVVMHEQGGSKATRQGYDTTWFVENTASVAVVLIWVDPDTNQEFSAVDSSIAPPIADPRAILKPGEWKAVWTYEGHVFYARALDPETGQAGNIVLQHRTGIHSIGEGVTGLSCPEADVEPLEVEAITGVPVRAAAYARTDLPHGMTRQCNQIDIGFRNAANCPLNGYWIPPQGVDTAPTASNTLTTASCPTEEFKLHLGMEAITPNFHHDWQSNTKFEGSAIGHSFAFRLASNPSILVETVTLGPTKIIDCPNRQQETVDIQIIADRVIVPVRFRHNDHNYNATTSKKQEQLWEYYPNATSLQNQEYVKIDKRGVSGGIGSRYGAASAVSAF